MTTLLSRPLNATLGGVNEPVRVPADDAPVRAWGRGEPLVSKGRLLASARTKINKLLRLQHGWDGHRASPTQPLAGMVVNSLLDHLLFDEAATPQLTPLPDGGLQVEWLVAGQSLEVEVGPTGDVLVTALDDTGVELVATEFAFWSPDIVGIDQARTFLEKISGDVRNRLQAT